MDNSELTIIVNSLVVGLLGWCLLDYIRSVSSVAREWHAQAARRLWYWSFHPSNGQSTRTHAGIN